MLGAGRAVRMPDHTRMSRIRKVRRSLTSLLLLLGEPASALDQIMEGRTVFIVAHRLSTMRNVDRSYFLEDGAIAGRAATMR